MNKVLPGFIDSLPEKDEFCAMIRMGRYGSSLSEIGQRRGLSYVRPTGSISPGKTSVLKEG